MIPLMPTVLDANFKDDSPMNTVSRIKQILKNCGIETEEKWNESGVPNCYSIRVSVFGTAFGVNGKGVTEEFALASAYGELMERLQLGKIFSADQQKESTHDDIQADKMIFPAKELLERNRKWYTGYVKMIKDIIGVEMSEEAFLAQYSNQEGNIEVVPFYCVNSSTTEYLPAQLLNAVYTTNGCAAGNSMEEAIVQAISEIVERNFSTRILMEEIAVPDIPEEVLQSFEISYQIITFLRENDFRVTVKDCSLGTKFPVACICLVNQKTGKYHTHFGAYPHFEIALQRTLTEAFQGRNINEIGRFERFVPRNECMNMVNLRNQLVMGASENKPEFFLPAAGPYEKTPGFDGKNNQELLTECIHYFCDLGYDLLIRDYSCLGFPTYQVIIPGFSEAFIYHLNQKPTPSQYTQCTQKVLRNPSAASMEDIMGHMMHLAKLTQKKASQARFSKQVNLPLQLKSHEEQCFVYASMAYLNYTLGRYSETIRYIDKMLASEIDKDVEKLVCIKRYLNLGAEGYTPEMIRKILEYFHRQDTVQQLYTAVSKGENLMDAFVANCDMQCQSTCRLHEICRKKKTDELVHFVNAKQREIDHSIVGKRLVKLLGQ